MQNNRIKKYNGIAILGAVLIVLALISNYVTIGSVNVNLALIPIILGACLYGPIAGLILGCIDGAIICVAPSTLVLFMSHNVPITILLCLFKTGFGGMVSGYFYRILKNKNDFVAVVIASLALPIINTGIFLIGVFLFFLPVYASLASESNVVVFVITSTLSINFLIEFLLNIILSSSIYRIIKYKRYYK